MQKKRIEIEVKVLSFSELSEEKKVLIEKAKEASFSAYAPYSKFSVGVAVLLENGIVVVGNNQENVAYPSGLCAERTALFAANANYPNVAPKALAIAAQTGGKFLENPISPCGSCRQVILEAEKRFGKEIVMLLFGEKNIYEVTSVRSLLPLAFDEI
jgi:cytidine deaminase